MEQIKEMIPFLIPLFIIQVALQVYCIVDLVKRETVRFNNKILWGVIIIIFNVIGSLAYIVFGRPER